MPPVLTTRRFTGRAILRVTLLTVSLTLPAACTTGTATGPSANADPTPISVQRAAQLFAAVCGATLPDFEGTSRAFAANGITRPSPAGSTVRYSRTEDVSFDIQDRPGGKEYSMVFGTADPVEGLALLFLGYWQVTPEASGTLGGERAGVRVGRILTSGGVNYVNVRMSGA